MSSLTGAAHITQTVRVAWRCYTSAQGIGQWRQRSSSGAVPNHHFQSRNAREIHALEPRVSVGGDAMTERAVADAESRHDAESS